ncbi:hypothetical protein JQU17_03475 [Ponticoccus sp. SC2-23]|nr:hypothetical protein [Ponticoccus sp. SC6-9]MBM1223682.1 hypothetical protein [Ponticoccus sp. SC6-15]MBM1229059.1 hypothetical protein [Ponticoccus sp. SC6-38]MBM1232648.1 hypothetical protein [Ponticoccus sp. SC6-45]MBM1237402.1 hypothetical protein [Ponticoccus sp. SC6-49]MBM1241659.1 hypothetical protein [Ponticoccus sp. SC2-64]MBM1246172.1 hypothetical protein [Ponticoccus sp. SC6-42]MBM1250650.1 hypothetical protein [Ponticoccus sp. SC6-33]MBM1255411.1 hypothetical protein [Pontico
MHLLRSDEGLGGPDARGVSLRRHRSGHGVLDIETYYSYVQACDADWNFLGYQQIPYTGDNGAAEVELTFETALASMSTCADRERSTIYASPRRAASGSPS